jgi:hypothetical protein
MSLRAIANEYISQKRPYAKAELDWFRRQPSLESAIDFAARAIMSNGKRHSHQYRIKRTAIGAARQVLLANSSAIGQSRNFDDLFVLISAMLKPIAGIGELYVYDTCLRIGARMNLSPQRVYLHAGTRTGARALGFKAKTNALDVTLFPTEFSELEPHEIEDVLCIFKDYLITGNVRDLEAGLNRCCAGRVDRCA